MDKDESEESRIISVKVFYNGTAITEECNIYDDRCTIPVPVDVDPDSIRMVSDRGHDVPFWLHTEKNEDGFWTLEVRDVKLTESVIVTYCVDNSSWTPIYRIETEDMTLRLFASIRNDTGKDWSAWNMKCVCGSMHVSPAPTFCSNAPRMMARAADVSPDDTETGYEYKIEGCIPANSYMQIPLEKARKITEPKVLRCTPCASRHGFITCDVDRSLVSLPGKTVSYYDTDSVAYSYIRPGAEGEKLRLTLAADTAVLCDFSSATRRNSNGIMMQTEASFVIRNDHESDRDIVVQEGTPVSKENAGNAELVEGGGAKLSEDGTLTWNLTVPAGKTVKKRFVYTYRA